MKVERKFDMAEVAKVAEVLPFLPLLPQQKTIGMRCRDNKRRRKPTSDVGTIDKERESDIVSRNASTRSLCALTLKNIV